MSYILTVSGSRFVFDSPKPAFCIYDIGHALSNVCRFAGHTRQFYSVAQHSVLVSRLVPPELRRAALLHDALEAYIGDITAPLKSQLPDYRALEARLTEALEAHFRISINHPEIKKADLVALATEKRDLMPRVAGERWPMLEGVTPIAQIITPLPPDAARRIFIKEWERLV